MARRRGGAQRPTQRAESGRNVVYKSDDKQNAASDGVSPGPGEVAMQSTSGGQASASITTFGNKGAAADAANAISNDTDGLHAGTSAASSAYASTSQGTGSGGGNTRPNVLKPSVQADLSSAELQEEIPRVLYARDPRKGTSLVRWAHKDCAYKQVAMADQTAVHYATDGWLMHVNAEEAKKQFEVEQKEREAEHALDSDDPAQVLQQQQQQATDVSTDSPDTSSSAAAAALISSSDKAQQLLRNSFNFSERATQAVPLPPRDKAVAAEPPKTMEASGTVTQWAIADAYRGKKANWSGAIIGDRDLGSIDVSADDSGGYDANGTGAADIVGLVRSSSATASETVAEEEEASEGTRLHGAAMERGTRVLERMTCLNAHRDIAMDFKYWEDAADAYRDGEGTLLPLWVFQPERGKKKHVTQIRWHPEHIDLFAATYGSFDFMKQGSGLVLLHTLKNPSHPERAYKTASGAMCIDFHQRAASLLAVGLYDGTVQVHDAKRKTSTPLMVAQPEAGPRTTSHGGVPGGSATGSASSGTSAGASPGGGGNGKHTDPVWGVRWQEDGELCFCSVSTDGRVGTWRATGGGLSCDDSLKLRRGQASEAGFDSDDFASAADEELALGSLLGGTCFDFNPASEQLLVVGTEEGEVHECSRAYSSQLLRRFDGHSMPVYAIRWNPMHPRVFATASADWTVKIWEDNNSKPALKLDLGSPVMDIQWQPASAGVFACATGSGKVVLYDLTVSRHEPACEQRVVKRARLTCLAFNPQHPVLLAGDDKGGITALKLSPNLRRFSKNADIDRDRLSRSLELARSSGGL